MMNFVSRGLLVVDPQLDFMPGGALPVPEGDTIIPVINRLIRLFRKEGSPVYISRDWHPQNHCSFVENGGQWPAHCIRGTRGAEFHPDLLIPERTTIIDKAVRKEPDAYSAFQDTGLSKILRDKGIVHVYTCGLATDVCVKSTVLDGIRAGFKMFFVSDASKAVELEPGDGDTAIQEMKDAGAVIFDSRKLTDQTE